MSKVFITTVSFNNNPETISFLESLEKVEKKDIQLFVVVVDNASKDKFKIANKFNNYKLEIIRSEENLGFSGGQNLGIKYSLENGADFVIILNNDTILDYAFLAPLINSLKNKVGIVSPKIYFAKGYEFHKEKYENKDLGKVIWYGGGIMDYKNIIGRHRGVDEVDTGQYDGTSSMDFATGCCMAIKREVFEKIGMLDEKYFLYYEDNDFSQRAKNAGFSIMFQPKSVVWHKNAQSAGGSGSSLQDYYITRNRLLFGLKFVNFRQKVALVKESFKLLAKGRKWQRKGVLDFYLGRLGKGSYPV